MKLTCVDYGDRLAVDLYFDSEKLNEQDLEIIVSRLSMYFQEVEEAEFYRKGLSASESELITAMNSTKQVFEGEQTIIDLFEQQVKKTLNVLH